MNPTAKRVGRPWAHPLNTPNAVERADYLRSLTLSQRQQAIVKERTDGLRLPPNGVWRRCGYNHCRTFPGLVTPREYDPNWIGVPPKVYVIPSSAYIPHTLPETLTLTPSLSLPSHLTLGYYGRETF